jgi:glycine dehydrogenase subunit 1
MLGANLPLDASPEDLIDLIDEDVCLVVVQYPDFLGRIHDLTKISQAAHEVNAFFAVHVNPLALGMLKPPSEFDADIVTGEGQVFGLPLSFGGPYLGIFATKEKYVRKMAGRLVGETVDSEGTRGYVLTLSTREQHIRREKATSNICTNQGLMALASAVYLSLLGKNGVRQLAELNYHKAHYAAAQIARLDGYRLAFDSPFFNEFTIQCPTKVAEINQRLLEYDFLGGFDLGKIDDDFSDHMLVAVTEMISKDQIDLFVSALEEVSHA